MYIKNAKIKRKNNNKQIQNVGKIIKEMKS